MHSLHPTHTLCGVAAPLVCNPRDDRQCRWTVCGGRAISASRVRCLRRRPLPFFSWRAGQSCIDPYTRVNVYLCLMQTLGMSELRLCLHFGYPRSLMSSGRDNLKSKCEVFRGLGALYAPISDCDEVFNYWEPLHFSLYGTGAQTWEYSPDFALRRLRVVCLLSLLTVVCLLSLLTVLLSTGRCLLNHLCPFLPTRSADVGSAAAILACCFRPCRTLCCSRAYTALLPLPAGFISCCILSTV